MRYEDASQTGTTGNDVNARDDADHLASNDFGPATGNLITGAGTITGATGTDSSGHIVAIQGAGGSDTSIADGQLQIAGQYGTLTIDADGNYSYARNPGSPEGVSDTFTYTLADNAGATDTANLVINIGDLPMLQAQGNQTIQTNDGVVVLPAGVELSDVRVVGRDLVVTLPDGSTMVIPDGAVFVPQLVLDGVEVPATNLAALLIDSEPKPGAGDLGPSQLSSGGNFALPPGPLDPGVPLGDLIPPTELTYTPPEFEEPGIEPEDDNESPLIGVSEINVSEEGVSAIDAPNPDNAGSPDTTNLRIVEGDLAVSDPDGDALTLTLDAPSASLTSQGVPITWAVSGDGHTVTGSAGGNAVITLVIEDDGHYTVTLSRPVDHPNAGGEQGTSFVVPVSVSDGEFITTGGSITVTIEDDSPTITGQINEPLLVVDDTTLGINDTDDFSGSVTVSFGADGEAASDALAYALGTPGGASGIVDVLTGEAVNLSLVGDVVEGRTATTNLLVFTVSVDGSGNVTLDQSRAVQHNDITDPFETNASGSAATLSADNLVTLSIVATDRDGDQASLSVNIGQNLRFEDDGPSITRNQSTVPSLVTDDTDISDTAGPVSFAGLFDAVFGNDGPKDADDNNVADADAVGFSLTVTGGDGTDSGLVDVISGDAILLRVNGDGDVEGYLENDTGTVAFTIDLDANGDISLIQDRAITHDDPTDPAETGADAEGMAAGLIVLTATVTDGDGDTDTATAAIGGAFHFEDDGPSIYEPENASLTNAAGAPTNFSLDDVLQGGDGDIADNFGADGPGVVRFQSSIDNTNSGKTSGGDTIWYILDATGTILQGKTGISAAAAEASVDPADLIYTVTIDQANDQYTVDMNAAIDSFGPKVFDDSNSDFVGGNEAWFGIVPNLQSPDGGTPFDDESEDILITPTNETSVNTSGILGGIDTGQSVGAGEGFRIDYVIDLTGTLPGGGTDYQDGVSNGHVFNGELGDVAADGTHWTTNGAFFTLRQSGGSDVLIKAFDDDNNNNIVGDGDQEAITKIVIKYTNADGDVFESDDLIPTGTEQTVQLDGIDFTYQLDADNMSVIVGNAQGATGANTEPATTIAVFTGDDGYNSLEVYHHGGETFKFAGFGAVVQSQLPVEISLPTEIVDGDGDVLVGGDIDITLTPPTPPLVLDTSGDGSLAFVDHSAGVSYDYNGDGLAESTAWVGGGDSILVRDANGDGTVTDASEFVFGGDGVTDMQALAAQYGETLDANDADFGQFQVWNDANGNAVADAGELTSLADAGITSIGLVSDGIAYTAANGEVQVAGSGTFTRADGTTGISADAAFTTGGAAKTVQEVERVAANSNNIALAAAVGAAGVVATAPAAAAAIDDGGHHQAFVTNAVVGREAVTDLGDSSDGTFSALAALHDGDFEFGAQALASSSHMALSASHIGELATALSIGNGPNALLDATDMTAMLQMPAMSNGMTVATAGLEALVPAMVGGNAQAHGGAVEQIVADALHGGGATDINALLNALPGGGPGAEAGLHGLATLATDGVSFGDMGHHGGFTFDAASIITTEAMVLHHDAVQPVANG